MKKRILVVLTFVLMASLILSGCSSTEKTRDNDVKSSDENVNANNNVDIKTSEGEIITGDSVAWPENNMGGLAKPNAVINAVLKDDTTGNCTVAFSAMSKEDAAQYVANLKAMGYQSIMEVNDADGVMFSGENSSGVMVTFTYNSTAKEGTVSYIPSPSESFTIVDDLSEIESIADMTDVSPWPQNFLAGVPELNGKIINVLNQDDENITVELEYVEKSDFEAYINTLKQNGYTVDADETKDSYSYDYRAYNQNGDYLTVYMNYESKNASVYMEKVVNE